MAFVFAGCPEDPNFPEEPNLPSPCFVEKLFSVSADFRPGYGYMIGVPLGIKSELHMFDWSIGIALRYYVK